MAVSRYRQNLAPVRSSYIPQMFTPNFGAYAELMGKQQAAIDEADALGEKVPKHMQKDYEDVTKYMGTIRNQIDELSQVYANQGIAEGNRKRKELLRTVSRDWQPGGKADRFQQRLNQFQLQRKQIEDYYKDDPRIAQFYVDRISVSPFEDTTAQNYGIKAPTLDKVLSTKEVGEYYDKVIGNIKADQVVKGPYLDRNALRGVSFKDLLRTDMVKYVDWNKAAQAIGLATTEEIKRSEEVRGQAYGLGEGQGQFLKFDDDGKLVKDEEGRIQFADTTLGRLLQGYATGATFAEESVGRNIVSHSFEEKAALKALDEQPDASGIMYTQPYNIGKTMFNNKDGYFKVKGNEIIVKGSKKGKEQDVRATTDVVATELQKRIPYFGIFNPATGVFYANNIASYARQLFGKNDRVSLDDPKLKNTVEVLTAEGYLKPDMTDEQKTQALASALNDKLINGTRSAQITPLVSTTTGTKKYKEGKQRDIFGDVEGGTPGYISNLVVWDQEGTPKTGTEVFNEARESGAPPLLEAEVMAPQSLLPYGTRTFNVGGKEYQVEPLPSDKNTAEYILNMQYRAASAALNGYSVEEELPQLNQEVFNQLPEEGKAKVPVGEAIYKMEHTVNGANLYVKRGSNYEKLNDEPLIFNTNAGQ